MDERGIVMEGGRGTARVRIERSPSCGDCGLCRPSGQHMIAVVVDRHGVAPGDLVRIATEAVTPLTASLILFGIPLLLLLAGCAAGTAVARAAGLAVLTQGFAVGGAVLFFAGSFPLIAIVNRRLPGRGRSVIVEVLDRQAAR